MTSLKFLGIPKDQLETPHVVSYFIDGFAGRLRLNRQSKIGNRYGWLVTLPHSRSWEAA